VANQVRVGVSAPGASKASSEVDKFRDSFKKLQDQGAKGLAIGAGFAAAQFGANLLTNAIGGIGSEIGTAIQAASDLNETENKAKVVFGASADAIERWGDTAAEKIGESKNAAIGAAATFGNLFESMGVGRDVAADLSMKMVNLAGDLASFNNIDPEEALQKLQSGIVGETKAVRDLGIDISETTVNQELMREGAEKVGGEYTNAQKILARYQLIIQQTSNAQGDFARTSDQLANTQRRRNAEMENEQAKLGQNLIGPSQAIDQLQINLLDFVNSGLEGWGMLGRAIRGEPIDAAAADQAAAIKAATDTMAGETAKQRDAIYGVANSLDKYGEHVDHAARKTWTIIPPVDGMAGAFSGAARDLDAMTRSADDLASELEDHLFGSTIRKGKEADIQGQISELAKQLKKTKDANDATAIKGQIADLEGQLLDLQVAEAASEGPDALKKELDGLSAKFKDTDARAYDLVQQLYAMYKAMGRLPAGVVGAVTGGISNRGTTLGARASGGPVSAGSAYVVGEHGPEVFVPGTNGGIVPNESLGSGGGVTVVVQLPNAYGMTPAQGDALGRQIAPHVIKAMQKGRILATPRAF